MTELPLAGRVAVVTGVSRRVGIGAGIAARLAADGADLLLHAWEPHDAEQPWGADDGAVEALAGELRHTGQRVEVTHADFAEPGAAASVMAAATERLGHVDIVVANHARSSSHTLEQVTADELDLCLKINARSTVLLTQVFAAQHDGRPGGRVVLFTSGQHQAGMPEEIPNALSKGAVQQITASLAAHLAPRAITVNCVNPGPTDTGYADGELREEVRQRMPMGRWGEPADAARLVAWLVSDEARWVTGQVVNSEGGFGLTR